MQFVKVSEAAAIGIHAMALLALNEGATLSMSRIAEELEVSSAHCSKVMQRLARAGYIDAVRGPSGGYRLAKPSTQIRLAEVLEAIEGPLQDTECLFHRQQCRFSACIFDGLFNEINTKVRDFFESTSLAAAAEKLGKKKGSGETMPGVSIEVGS